MQKHWLHYSKTIHETLFNGNLKALIKISEKKLNICAINNFGYDSSNYHIILKFNINENKYENISFSNVFFYK